MATPLSTTSAPQIASAPKLTGLFQSRVSQIAQPAASSRPIQASIPNLPQTGKPSAS